MLMQNIEAQRRIAAQHLAQHGQPIDIYDSWTHTGDLKTTNGLTRRNRPDNPLTHNANHPLFKAKSLKLNWLPSLMEFNMKVVCNAPQIRRKTTFDTLGSERLRGSVTLGAFGPSMIMATIHGTDAGLPSAITVQLRGHERHGLIAGHTDTRLVAFIGSGSGIRRNMSDLYRFLRHPAWVKRALANGKTRRNALEPFDYAGMPHSPEARLYAEIWHLQTPGIRRMQSFAQPVVKAHL